ncbi:MAG: hypothetical protein AAFO74_05005 [Pseudomonadota bacterium]
MLLNAIATQTGAPPQLQAGDLAALQALEPSIATALPWPAITLLSLIWVSAVVAIGIELRAEKID